METEKHYFKVGLFFLGVMVAFVYYLVAFGGENANRNLKRYTVYFEHSVDGMERGASVKLKGIDVGQVHEIRFVSADNDRIRVTADIADTAPVRTDTAATVAFQGITGSTFLSLDNAGPADKSAPLTAVPAGEKYPVIPSRQSGVQSLLDSAPDVMSKVNEAIGQTDKLFSDKNVKEASALLPEAHEALAQAAAAFNEFKMLARELREDPSVILRGPKYEGYKVPQK